MYSSFDKSVIIFFRNPLKDRSITKNEETGRRRREFLFQIVPPDIENVVLAARPDSFCQEVRNVFAESQEQLKGKQVY